MSQRESVGGAEENEEGFGDGTIAPGGRGEPFSGPVVSSRAAELDAAEMDRALG